MSSVSLDCSSLSPLRQALSFTLQFTGSASLARLLAPGIPCLCLPNAGCHAFSFSMGAGGLNSSPQSTRKSFVITRPTEHLPADRCLAPIMHANFGRVCQSKPVRSINHRKLMF